MRSHHTSTSMSYSSLTVKTAATMKFLMLAHLPTAKACLETAVNYHRCLIICKPTATAKHDAVPSALGYLAMRLVRQLKKEQGNPEMFSRAENACEEPAGQMGV